MRERAIHRVADLAGRSAKALLLVAALALGLALAGCDRCGDFFWHRQPGSCHATPAPN
jgi:hypothetical protein